MIALHVQKSEGKMIKWYQKASKQGSADTQINIEKDEGGGCLTIQGLALH